MKVWFPYDQPHRHKVTGKTLFPGENDLPDELAACLLGSGLVMPMPADTYKIYADEGVGEEEG